LVAPVPNETAVVPPMLPALTTVALPAVSMPSKPVIVPVDWLVTEPPAARKTPRPLTVLPLMLPAFTTVATAVLP
jgi:hypothetical protein